MAPTLPQLALVVLFSCLMACGQLLFRYSAGQLAHPESPLDSLLGLIFLPTFWLACLLYAGATVFWIWILTRVPLSVAYPASSVALVIVPLLGWLLFSERLTPSYWLGLALMLGGLFVLTR